MYASDCGWTFSPFARSAISIAFSRAEMKVKMSEHERAEPLALEIERMRISVQAHHRTVLCRAIWRMALWLSWLNDA